MTATKTIIDKYLSFFEKRGHKVIPGAPLVPENDPTTLFTSSGMQPLVPYLLGETHPLGKRLVNVQNSFRAGDIDEVGDNRHTTFFRMLGNWSLGDYFKKEQLPWFFEFLTKELGIDPERLYVSVFEGFDNIPRDVESANIWKEIFDKAGINPEGRIFYYGVEKNWWSRSGLPSDMPVGEPGGPDSEVFYDFGEELGLHEKSKFKDQECHPNCDCGRFLEIGNSVFMEYVKTADGFKPLPQKNVDFGGGLERILAAIEKTPDIFKTNLFEPVVKAIEKKTEKKYETDAFDIRIVINHFVSSVFIVSSGVAPSNKEQGYILRRLLRRGLDSFYKLGGKDISSIVESIVESYKETDSYLTEKFENIKFTIIQEEQNYKQALLSAKKYIAKKYKSRIPEGKEVGDELMGVEKISAEDAFILYSTHGLSPTQIRSLGYEFDEQEFAEKMEEHQVLSRKGAEKKFAGGLADHSEKVIKGHTATHLLHRALKDILGESVNQVGSNITSERVRFDFSFDRKLTPEEVKRIEDIVNRKIRENLSVSSEVMSPDEAKKAGAIGLFGEKYADKVKVYSIGPSAGSGQDAYSKEICGGPHVRSTEELKSFKIIKEEGLGSGKRRIYAIVE